MVLDLRVNKESTVIWKFLSLQLYSRGILNNTRSGYEYFYNAHDVTCGDESANTDGKQQAEKQVVSEKSEKGKQEETVETIDYTPKMDILKGPKRPALLVSQAWFHQTKSKKPIPGPARLENFEASR